MSRIDEALRRAAGQPPPAAELTDDTAGQPASGSEWADETTGPPDPPAAVDVLAREPFPMEGLERRRLTAEEAGPHTPEPPPSPEPAAAPASTNGSVFDRIDAELAEKVVVDAHMSPGSREQYRRLAAVLHDAQATSSLNVVMIVSAVAGEGKTLTACNLALTLSESYHRRVLLIDGDLRRPTLHRVFGLTAASGLVEGLQAEHDAKLVVRQLSPRLAVLPAGRPTSDPMAGLTSARMRKLLEEARNMFEWVIIDTPPLILLPDAHLLSSMVDGAVVVVQAGSTPHDLVTRAVDIIGKPRVVGVVLNRAEARAQAGYGEAYGPHYYLRAAEGASRT